MKKLSSIILNSLPVLLMIALIPAIKNDYILTVAYIVIIFFAQLIKHERKDLTIFLCGFIAMIISEYIFISTGVETFIRNTLFGLMPLWLPFLWGYAFIAIRRSIKVLES